MLKYVSLIGLLILSGCASRSELQAMANARAGNEAVKQLIALDRSKEAVPVVDAVMAYELAAVNTPAADLPAPQFAAAAIVADAKPFVSSAPPEPVKSTVWGWLAAGGMAALWGIGRIAPTMPGLGSLAGGVANMLWETFAHANQKRADTVAANTTASAAQVASILGLIAMNKDSLPESIKDKIDLKVLDAMTSLATTLATPKA